jgi:hypothetical protein
MIRELFRALEASIHERLGMIEDVLRLSSARGTLTSQVDSQQRACECSSAERIQSLENELQTVSARLAALETTDVDTSKPAAEVHVHRVGTAGEEMWIEPMRDLKIELKTVLAPISPPIVAATTLNKVVEEEVVEEEVVEEEVVEEEVVEEEEEAEEEEAEEEEAEEEEAEEEALELDEIEYKGKTYYRDGNNHVYAPKKDDPSDIDIDTPIGTWDSARERILFRRAV